MKKDKNILNVESTNKTIIKSECNDYCTESLEKSSSFIIYFLLLVNQGAALAGR